MNFTKGEWKVEKRLSSQMPYGIFHPHDEKIIPVAYIRHKDDAHLISSAPQMYEALKALEMYRRAFMSKDLALFEKALAKAEGREE